jgi:hypothetical protein
MLRRQPHCRGGQRESVHPQGRDPGASGPQWQRQEHHHQHDDRAAGAHCGQRAYCRLGRTGSSHLLLRICPVLFSYCSVIRLLFCPRPRLTARVIYPAIFARGAALAGCVPTARYSLGRLDGGRASASIRATQGYFAVLANRFVFALFYGWVGAAVSGPKARAFPPQAKHWKQVCLRVTRNSKRGRSCKWFGSFPLLCAA